MGSLAKIFTLNLKILEYCYKQLSFGEQSFIVNTFDQYTFNDVGLKIDHIHQIFYQRPILAKIMGIPETILV